MKELYYNIRISIEIYYISKIDRIIRLSNYIGGKEA